MEVLLNFLSILLVELINEKYVDFVCFVITVLLLVYVDRERRKFKSVFMFIMSVLLIIVAAIFAIKALVN